MNYSIDDFDEEIVEELRNRANDTLLTQALSSGGMDNNSHASLLEMEGMTKDLAEKLAAIGIMTMDELAEQSVDELLVIAGMTEKKAGTLIMKAREPWFSEDK